MIDTTSLEKSMLIAEACLPEDFHYFWSAHQVRRHRASPKMASLRHILWAATLAHFSITPCNSLTVVKSGGVLERVKQAFRRKASSPIDWTKVVKNARATVPQVTRRRSQFFLPDLCEGCEEAIGGDTVTWETHSSVYIEDLSEDVSPPLPGQVALYACGGCGPDAVVLRSEGVPPASLNALLPSAHLLMRKIYTDGAWRAAARGDVLQFRETRPKCDGGDRPRLGFILRVPAEADSAEVPSIEVDKLYLDLEQSVVFSPDAQNMHLGPNGVFVYVFFPRPVSLAGGDQNALHHFVMSVLPEMNLPMSQTTNILLDVYCDGSRTPRHKSIVDFAGLVHKIVRKYWDMKGLTPAQRVRALDTVLSKFRAIAPAALHNALLRDETRDVPGLARCYKYVAGQYLPATAEHLLQSVPEYFFDLSFPQSAIAKWFGRESFELYTQKTSSSD